MGVHFNFIAITPEEFRLFSNKKRTPMSISLSDFKDHTVFTVEKFAYPAYCTLIKSYPHRPLLEQPILGGDAFSASVDGKLGQINFLSKSLVAAIARELDDVSFDVLSATVGTFVYGEKNILNMSPDVTKDQLFVEVELIIRGLQEFYSQCANLGQPVLIIRQVSDEGN